MNTVYTRQSEHKNYISPLKSNNITPTASITPKTQKKPYLHNYIHRPISPMESRVAVFKSRKESALESDKQPELIILNERLRQEADFWHRKCIDQENNNNKDIEHLELKEVQKLIYLCEKQAAEIRDLKAKCEQNDSSASNTRYESSLNQEIQDQLKTLDTLYAQLNEQASQIIKFQRNEDNLKQQCQKYQDELLQQRKSTNQFVKDQHNSFYSKDQHNSSQLDALQQSHMKQINVLNEQISLLQQEIIKKSDQNEQLRRDYEQMIQEITCLQDNQDQLQQTLEQFQMQCQQLKEEKRRELLNLQQTKDSQISNLNKFNQDQRQQYQNRISSLEQQTKEFQNEQMKFKNESTQIQIQFQDAQSQIKIYQENIEQLQSQHELEIQSINENESIKGSYQRQMDQMMNEVEKLKSMLNEKMEECEQNKQGVEELSGYLENAEANENELLKELEKWKLKYEELEQHCESEISKIDDENANYIEQLQESHNMQMENFDNQLRSMQSIMDSKMKECDELRGQKNELAIKVNELNVDKLIQYFQLVNQQVNGEVETLAQRFMEQQRQYEIEDQVKEEIKRSQLEQVRRQLENQLDQLGNENRNLKFLLDGKIKECDDWKQTFLKSRSNQSTMN